MQFSFDKFFQMIEERFGRRVANGLLLLVAVAIAVLALSIIIVQGIVPTAGLVSEFMRGSSLTVSWVNVLSFLLTIFLPAACIWAVERFLIYPRNEATAARIRTHMDDIQRLA